MRFTLILFDGVSELDRLAIGGVTVAASDHVILDAHGGIDRMPEQADILLGQRTAEGLAGAPHRDRAEPSIEPSSMWLASSPRTRPNEPRVAASIRPL